MQWLSSPTEYRKLAAEVEQSEFVHIHGLWETPSAIACHLTNRLKKPYLISAHGMLDPWALTQGKLKKTLYWNLLEKHNLARAASLRALTTAEADQYRDLGLTNPIAVIPNGVTIPDSIDPEAFLQRFPNLRNNTLLLYLGRLHAKKGLDILFESWNHVATKTSNGHLVIAGPDPDNMQSSLKARLTASSANERTTFTGMLDGPLKWSGLKAASAFLLPSRSEGFSMAVLEALGVGTPVVITPHCHFSDVQQRGCGWEIQATAADITHTLLELLRLSPSALSGMGTRGQDLIRSQYSWSVVGDLTASMLDSLR